MSSLVLTIFLDIPPPTTIKTNYRGYYGALYYKGRKPPKSYHKQVQNIKVIGTFMTDATFDNKYTDFARVSPDRPSGVVLFLLMSMQRS